jgi:hypothetical protein
VRKGISPRTSTWGEEAKVEEGRFSSAWRGKDMGRRRTVKVSARVGRETMSE